MRSATCGASSIVADATQFEPTTYPGLEKAGLNSSRRYAAKNQPLSTVMPTNRFIRLRGMDVLRELTYNVFGLSSEQIVLRHLQFTSSDTAGTSRLIYRHA